MRPSLNYLRATRGAPNPNLQVFITHASHVCNQHSFGFPLRMNGMHRMQFDHTCLDHLSREIYAKHSVEAKAFDLRSLSLALSDLRLLLQGSL